MPARCIKWLGFFGRAILLIGLIAAASTFAAAERLPVKIFTTADGLGHNDVNRIVRDSRGFLWFCTFDGLSRFDGYGFTTYGRNHGLPSPVVNDLLETRAGQYWVATGVGLCRFNPKGSPQQRSTNGAQESAADSVMFAVYFPAEDEASKNVLSLFEDSKGTIWCGTAAGLYRLEEQNGQPAFHYIELGVPTGSESHSLIRSIIEGRRGALWIGSATGVYRLLPDGRAERYSHERNGLPSNGIHSLLEDREGRLWVGTREGGLFLLVSDPDPARTVVARVYTQKDGLPTRWINQIFQASDGSLWAGGNQGLIHFIPTADGQDLRFHVYAQPHGLNYTEVQSLAEDRNGNLWLGMLNGGAIKLTRSGITAFTDADGFKWAGALFKDKAGGLFVIGSSSVPSYFVNRFDGGRFTAIELQVPRGSTSWGWNQLLLEDQAGEWWCATGRGLYRFPKVNSFERLARTPPKAIYTTRDGLAGSNTLRLFEDSRGDIWIGTVASHGLSRWERSSGTFHHYTEEEGLPAFARFYPISFCEDRAGAVWIGFSFGGGLVRYRDGRFARFTSADGLAEGGIFNLFVDSAGRLWVPTTRGGVCRIDDPQAERPTVFTYTTEYGLSSNDVRCVTEDRWGRLYFGTARGLDRLDPASGRFKHYTTADGVLLVPALSAMQDRDGVLWFASATGLMRLVPEPDPTPLPPPILITGLRIGGETHGISALGETDIASVELGPDKNQIQLDFVALGFSPGEGLRYQYRLEGASEDWSQLSDQRTVNFARLAPGRYRFLVRAVNADGVMSESPASFSFTILPPVWQRWWFIAIVTALMGLLVYSLFRFRVGRLLEIERVRTRIASDLHDDIGSNLTKIAILNEVAQQQIGIDPRLGEDTLSSSARISRESLASMSDIVWAINPKKDRLDDLARRIRGFASEIFSSRNISFRFHAPEQDQDLKLGPDVRRDVYLIFKEAVNNIVRHSESRSADIELRLDGQWLVLRVSDDGKGFDIIQADEGNGLAGMRRRAEVIGGRLSIDTTDGRGTTVTLRVPAGAPPWRRVLRRGRKNGRPT